MITLQPITRENFRQTVKLKVHPHEKNFVAPNMYSIAEAYTEPGTRPRAIYHLDTLVGFTLYGKWDEDEDYWIARLMVDTDHRRKGYAKAAMELVIDELQKEPDCKTIYLSFVPKNVEARELYLQLGFVDTGKVEEGEIVFAYHCEKE